MNEPLRAGSASRAHSPDHRSRGYPPPTWGKTMLKQILATTTVIAIVFGSVQSASAARSKLRQLVVEPTGASSEPILKKKKKFQQLVIDPSPGIPTPAGKANGKKVAKFIVAPGGGIATPADS